MECVESGRRREDVAPVHWRVHQAGLHRWRPGLSTALQRPVRPDDIVRAAQEVDVPVELVGATGVAGRATAQVRRALANRAGETLDERGVLMEGLGILRLPQRSLQPTRRADPPAPFDSDDAIVPPSLEHVTRDARRPKEGRWCTTLRLRRGSCRLSGHGDRCGCTISTYNEQWMLEKYDYRSPAQVRRDLLGLDAAA